MTSPHLRHALRFRPIGPALALVVGLTACRKEIPTPVDPDIGEPRGDAAAEERPVGTRDAVALSAQTGAEAGATADRDGGPAGDRRAADGATAAVPAGDAAAAVPAGDAAAGGGASRDAGVGAPEADASAPRPLEPVSHPGLVLWLDAAHGVATTNGRVTRWEDRSPSNNDALQPDAAARPALVMGARGAPVVRFSGKVEPLSEQKGAGGPFLRIVDAPSLNWGTDDFTLLVVAGYDNPLDGSRHGSFGAFYSKWGGDRPPDQAGPEVLFTGNWPVPPMTAISAIHIGFGGPRPGVNSARQGLNDGAVRLYGARRAGDVLEVRINGAVDATTRGVDDVDVGNPGANVGVGSMSGDRGIRALRGDILLLVAIRGPFPTEDLRRLEDSIKARFQLSP